MPVQTDPTSQMLCYVINLIQYSVALRGRCPVPSKHGRETYTISMKQKIRRPLKQCLASENLLIEHGGSWRTENGRCHIGRQVNDHDSEGFR